MLMFVSPRPRLLFPRLLLLFRLPPELTLLRLRSFVLTLLRPPCVPEPPAPGRLPPWLGRLWLPPLIDVPDEGRDVLGRVLPLGERLELPPDERGALLAPRPPPPPRLPPPPPMR